MTFLGLRKLGNICCGHRMFLNKIRNLCVPDTKFVSATNVARAGKRGNISVGNNVSATMCLRLPGPLERLERFSMTFTADGNTAKITSDFLFSPCDPEINHTKIENSLLGFTANSKILILLYRELKTDGKSFIFAVCRLP